MAVPILKQGKSLIASIQSALTDADLVRLRDDLLRLVTQHRSDGVIIDVTALDVLDSFAARTLNETSRALKLKGAKTVIAGIAPDVAIAMVRLGLTLEGVETVLDLEEALDVLDKLRRRAGRRG